MDNVKFNRHNFTIKIKNFIVAEGFSLISNPFVLSLLFAIIVILLLPPVFTKYVIFEVSKDRTPLKGPYTYYYDLDKDGYSDKIEVHTGTDNNVGIIVYTKGGVIDQWNFRGEIKKVDPFNIRVFFGDINNNGIDEIFVATFFRDTIYLSCFNPFENKYYFKEISVSYYHKYNGTIDAGIYKCALYDMNNDGINEIYFSINTGHSKYPRRMYAYDAVNDTLYKSPLGCITYQYPVMFDIDKDGKPELFGSPQAVGNCKESAPYSDQYLWLSVLDEKMNFEFEPKIIGYYPTMGSVTAFTANNENYIAVLNNYSGLKNIKSSISLFDSSGMKIKEKLFEKSFNLNNARLFSNGNYKRLFFIQETGIIEELNKNLEVISKYKIPPTANGIRTQYDLDNDGENENLFWGKNDDNIIITEKDFSDPTVFKFPELQQLYYFALVENGAKGNELFIFGEKNTYRLKYEKNMLYYFRYLIYAGIYAGIFVLILFIQKGQKHRLERKYAAEKKIAELQLRSIKNQIDPHFTLNIINSIGSLFYKQDAEKANFIFGKYSKLLRNTILGSDQILTTIDSELDYVENYLELEKFRLKDKFTFTIKIDESVNRNLKIPKTLIHTFAENAVKHGINHSGEKGIVQIEVFDERADYKICIRDNGIGRKKAKEFSAESTGKGLKIFDEILELYFNLMKIKITYKIIDLSDNESNPAGTEVCIKIPIV